MRIDILALFLLLGENLYYFYSFIIKYNITTGFHWCFLSGQGSSLLVLVYWVFISCKNLGSCDIPCLWIFCINRDDHVFFFYWFCQCGIYDTDFYMFSHSGIPGINPTCSCFLILFMCCWNQCVCTLLRIFPMFIRNLSL